MPLPKAGWDYEVKKAKGASIYSQYKDINGYRGDLVLADSIQQEELL